MRLALFLSLTFIFFIAAANLEKVCFKKKCFTVEVVSTEKELTQGLMFRDYLAKDRGMLFVFPKEGFYPFWMKNTKIPLDIIWLDQQKNVVFISKNCQPCSNSNCPNIMPTKNALYVLELNAGICDSIGLKVGDKLKF